MPIEGAIAERARGILPVTWDALAGDSRYGDALLQSVVDTVKEWVFGEVVAPEAETYPLIVIDYAAKLIAIELTVPGVDFWMNQSESVTTTGTDETESFTDRAEKLRELRKDLLEATRDIADEVGALIPIRRRRTGAPLSNTLEEPFLTPSPFEFPRPYAATERS